MYVLSKGQHQSVILSVAPIEKSHICIILCAHSHIGEKMGQFVQKSDPPLLHKSPGAYNHKFNLTPGYVSYTSRSSAIINILLAIWDTLQSRQTILNWVSGTPPHPIMDCIVLQQLQATQPTNWALFSATQTHDVHPTPRWHTHLAIPLRTGIGTYNTLLACPAIGRWAEPLWVSECRSPCSYKKHPPGNFSD